MNHPDFETVEFRIEGWPASLSYAGATRELAWADIPPAAADEIEHFEPLIDPIKHAIHAEALTHIPAAAAVRAAADDLGFRIVEIRTAAPAPGESIPPDALT